jgi:hypothetical protein
MTCSCGLALSGRGAAGELGGLRRAWGGFTLAPAPPAPAARRWRGRQGCGKRVSGGAAGVQLVPEPQSWWRGCLTSFPRASGIVSPPLSVCWLLALRCLAACSSFVCHFPGASRLRGWHPGQTRSR